MMRMKSVKIIWLVIISCALFDCLMVLEQIQGINIYLIGMMGAGKSTVGEILANRLSYKFFDTDVLISQVSGQAIPEIFSTQGEEEFRNLESQVLSSLCAYQHLVVATGGGVVIKRMNWSYLRHGIIVWLDVPTHCLYERLKGDTTRPLLQHPDPLTRLDNILETRRHLYQQADISITINGNEKPSEIAEQIITKIPNILKQTESHLN